MKRDRLRLPSGGRALLLSVAGLLCAVTSADAADGIYPQDKLQVQVLEWMPAKGEYKAWEAVTGEYAVSQGHSISFPFIGAVSTVGRSTDDLARFVSTELQSRMSLPLPPDVTVNFTTRAPIYVIGGIQTPGQVPFSPGITPIKAIALSGGFFRGGGGEMRLERDAISSAAALETAENEAARLVAKLGRLDAELIDGETLVTPKEAGEIKPTPEMLEEEQALLSVRLQARKSRLESTENRKKLAEDQLKALRDQADNLQRQVELMNQELDGVKKLVNQGLAAVSRSLTLERESSALQGKKLELDIATLQAQLEANQADRDAVELVTTFRTEVANEAQLARATLSQRMTDIDSTRKLLREATVIAPEALIERAGNMRIGIRIYVTRTVGDRSVTEEIGKDSPLQGGDTIQIELDTSPSATVAAGNAPATPAQ